MIAIFGDGLPRGIQVSYYSMIPRAGVEVCLSISVSRSREEHEQAPHFFGTFISPFAAGRGGRRDDIDLLAQLMVEAGVAPEAVYALKLRRSATQ